MRRPDKQSDSNVPLGACRGGQVMFFCTCRATARELIARELYTGVIPYSVSNPSGERRMSAYEKADRVVAALCAVRGSAA